MPTSNSIDVVYETCLLLVAHFRNLNQHGKSDVHTRIFSHMLHPEEKFVYAGKSEKVGTDTPTHPEHVVPCKKLIEECQGLIGEGKHSDEQIASLLQKHWKVATITKAEQKHLDYHLGYKSSMPVGWTFESGDTFERFKLAGIVLLSL